ncbi:MAG: hypothetical protein QNK23_12595 [Crocinitomicaceae bacterium]|nr:hypothetical protein [Crocinitomicaceae bacterium]
MNLIQQKLILSWPFLLGLILGMYLLVFGVLGMDLNYFPGDLGDARFNAYILEHGYQFFSGQVDSYWSAPFMYPEQNVITFSDNLIGTVPVYSIFRLFGADVLSSFQGWFILVSALNYFCAYYFLKWLTKNRYAAVLGAFIFAFSIVLQSQMTHAQIFPRFFIPLALWMLLRFKESLSPRHFFWAVFFLIAQFYAGIYLGFMLTIPFGIILLSILFYSKRTEFFVQLKKLKWIGMMAAASAFNLFLLGKLMLPYYERSKTMVSTPYESIVHSIPTLKSFFYSQPGSLLWDGLSNTGSDYLASWDHQLFPGIIVILSMLLVTIVVLFQKRLHKFTGEIDGNIKLLFAAGLISFLLFTRYQGYSLYQFVYKLPGFDSMRSLTRIINVELLFMGIAVAVVAVIIFKRFEKLTIPIFIGLFTLICIDNYFFTDNSYRTEKSIAQERTDTLVNRFSYLNEGSLISYEPLNFEFPAHVYQLDAMLASQELHLKTVNGYTGNSPHGYDAFWWDMDQNSRNQWFDVVGHPEDTLHIIH